MSRFYETLKQAGHYGQPLNGHAAQGQPETPEANRSADPAVSLPPPLSPPPDVAPPSEIAGSPLHVTLDRTARLLPNTADRAVVEQYRKLRTKLIQMQGTKPFQSIVIVSPGPQEGKSVTAMNLGFSFSMLPNCKVLIIDGDMRKGSLSKWLGLDNRPGLSNLIDGSATIEEVLLDCEGIPMRVMVRGTSTRPPAELLYSKVFKNQFRNWTRKFDLVLVDSPPTNLVTDAQLLAENCDGVLLVARAYTTSRKAMEQAAQDLAPFRILGSILNGGTSTPLYRKYGDYY